MATESSPLHILFFPFMAHGHLLPLADVARLFALRGVKCTFLTTPGNVAYVRPTIDHTNNFIERKDEPDLTPISISLIPFPSAEVGLPDGLENASIGVFTPEMRLKFIQVISLLEKPFEQLLNEIRPDAFVSDTFYNWSADVSSRTGIPRLVFNGMGLLARCAQEVVFQILDSAPVSLDKFVIPGMPHRLEMHRTQFSGLTKNKELISKVKYACEMDARSYGEVVNSFLELEEDYAMHWREVVGRRAWLIGPVVLSNAELSDKSIRGEENASLDAQELLQWLDSKRPNSVVYICFGSLTTSNISTEQLRKIAIALDESGRDFIWVLKSSPQEGSHDWLEEFEKRMLGEKRGLIIKGWAPQILILNHSAVGGFLTHCGWNSTLEAISAGVPMITWPMNGDQFFNEKLIVELQRVGVAVGAKEGGPFSEKTQLIEAETIKSAIETVVGDGLEGKEMRQRAMELKEKARDAVQEGGSSHAAIGSLIEELLSRRDANLI